jgi:hypothetical protein
MVICTYSLANPARNAYEPHCDVICGYTCRHYLINGAIFGKKIEYKIVFIFSTIHRQSWGESFFVRLSIAQGW